MIGAKIYKPLNDYTEYTKHANWCNKNGAIIEDKGKYYEITKLYTPYTLNPDNSINILGGSNSLDTLHKILPNQQFEVFDGEPYEFNGKYYLSESDVSEAEKEAKEEADEEQRVQSLQPTVEEQVTEISESLLALTLAQEETIAQLTEQNEALHAQLSEVSEALVGLMFGE